MRLLRKLCPELRGLTSDSGVFRRLKAWKVSWKVGRVHVISPDPEYDAKVKAIKVARARAHAAPDKVRFLYVDELTYYRRPASGRDWHARGGGGRAQPKVDQAPGPNTKRRIIGALDAVDGRTTAMTRSSMGSRPITHFLRKLRTVYGPDVEIILAWDNWPPHHQESVLQTAKELGITLLYTPTYAPWTNFIEKLWDKLKDEILRLHRLSDAWKVLRARVEAYLEDLARPNPELLRFVGLSPLAH